MNFEPKETLEPLWIKFVVCLALLILISAVIQLSNISKAINQAPTNFIKELHTEINP